MKLFVQGVSLEAEVRKGGMPVETGVFSAEMKVALINDGPITLLLQEEGS